MGDEPTHEVGYGIEYRTRILGPRAPLAEGEDDGSGGGRSDEPANERERARRVIAQHWLQRPADGCPHRADCYAPKSVQRNRKRRVST